MDGSASPVTNTGGSAVAGADVHKHKSRIGSFTVGLLQDGIRLGQAWRDVAPGSTSAAPPSAIGWARRRRPFVGRWFDKLQIDGWSRLSRGHVWWSQVASDDRWVFVDAPTLAKNQGWTWEFTCQGRLIGGVRRRARRGVRGVDEAAAVQSNADGTVDSRLPSSFRGKGRGTA